MLRRVKGLPATIGAEQLSFDKVDTTFAPEFDTSLASLETSVKSAKNIEKQK